ncbi:hypothetical protein EYF80_028599 [Liparis tanakae]|uniref:Uncharacterized protein n=1 Tax=Liparis tanakae TaxID=230148 RepID=A0A4Z2H8M7_9TELE|nr:hypothetical protein EYF80_028599 [Liparis tanakae]
MVGMGGTERKRRHRKRGVRDCQPERATECSPGRESVWFDVLKCFLRRILERFLVLSFLKDEAAQRPRVLNQSSLPPPLWTDLQEKTCTETVGQTGQDRVRPICGCHSDRGLCVGEAGVDDEGDEDEGAEWEMKCLVACGLRPVACGLCFVRGLVCFHRERSIEETRVGCSISDRRGFKPAHNAAGFQAILRPRGEGGLGEPGPSGGRLSDTASLKSDVLFTGITISTKKFLLLRRRSRRPLLTPALSHTEDLQPAAKRSHVRRSEQMTGEAKSLPKGKERDNDVHFKEMERRASSETSCAPLLLLSRSPCCAGRPPVKRIKHGGAHCGRLLAAIDLAQQVSEDAHCCPAS